MERESEVKPPWLEFEYPRDSLGSRMRHGKYYWDEWRGWCPFYDENHACRPVTAGKNLALAVKQ
jgi:hypothetical protein